MGSGKYLNHAQKKYGIENFTKEILFVFDTPEEMYAKEAEIVNEDFISYENTYNVKVGGNGGWSHINDGSGKAQSIAGKVGGKALWAKHRESLSRRLSERTKNAHKTGKLKYNNFTDKRHTAEAKKRIGEKNSKHQIGCNNSQFGTCWISHELVGSKKCNKDLLYAYIDQGWVKGRNIFK